MIIANKKIIIFVLILAFTAFIGCKNDTAKTEDPKTPEFTEGETAEAKNEPIVYKADYLPDIKFDGYDFRMVAPSLYGLYVSADCEEETGDTLNDAIYKRNRLIENRYDINIRQIDGPDWPDCVSAFNKSVMANSDDFDLCMLISREAWAACLKGTVMPLGNLPYCDITQPWYIKETNKEISINGKHYFVYSDECLCLFGQTMCVLFNKQLASDLALENMYALVNEGKWTVDKFFELAKTAVADLDGDGTLTDSDRFGVVSLTDFFYPTFWVGSGIKTIGKDENDLLTFIGDDDKMYGLMEKVYQYVHGGEKVFFDGFQDPVSKFANAAGEPGRAPARTMFGENHGLFVIDCVAIIESFRNMEADFGILPGPKYDEAQEKYYSRVIDGWLNCAPVHAANPERTSIIMEALAVESKNITVPAYIEIALRTKQARDDESQDMINLIHETMTMDIGDTFYMDPVRNMYVNVIAGKKNNFASAVEKSMSRVLKTLETANTNALNLN
jgi:hypothetical protein